VKGRFKGPVQRGYRRSRGPQQARGPRRARFWLTGVEARSRLAGEERGYILLLVAFMMALILIGLLGAFESISGQLRRDREEEMIHRGAQYARAIKKYYRKFSNYPSSFEQLENTNHLRFLRKRYKDPMTGKDFRALHFGDVQLSLKPPGMATGPGVAPGSGLAAGAAAASQANPSPSPGASPAGSGPDASSQNPSSGSGQAGSTQASPFASASQMGGTGPTFGGGPIIGVASTSEKQAFHVFNKKDQYKDWEFIYDPTTDRGNLINGPYDGTLAIGGGQVPGAVAPGQPGRAVNPAAGSPFGGFNQGANTANPGGSTANPGGNTANPAAGTGMLP